MWLSEACSDGECACVRNYGCQRQHDCHCPDASLPHTSLSMSSDSLATKLQFSTKSANSYYILETQNVNKDSGTWQEPAQVGYFESDEPGIERIEDAAKGSLYAALRATWGVLQRVVAIQAKRFVDQQPSVKGPRRSSSGPPNPIILISGCI